MPLKSLLGPRLSCSYCLSLSRLLLSCSSACSFLSLSFLSLLSCSLFLSRSANFFFESSHPAANLRISVSCSLGVFGLVSVSNGTLLFCPPNGNISVVSVSSIESGCLAPCPASVNVFPCILPCFSQCISRMDTD